MSSDFEDHCWKDLVPAEILDIYAPYRRKTFVGPSPALVAIDLYEMAYQGGPLPVAEVTQKYPSSCGEHAWAAIAPTQRLFDAARRAGLPVFYSTGDARADARPDRVSASVRRTMSSELPRHTLTLMPYFFSKASNSAVLSSTGIDE